MDFENKNTAAETQPEGNGSKTFTQEDVNRIVGDRLAKDRAKNDADLIKREQDLKQRELAMSAREVLSEKGLPKELADILKFSDEDTMNKSIESLEKIFNDYKANATSNVKFRGFQPGASVITPSAALSEDAELRKAMRLNI
ncbi:MAG: DUF4355 domain-containing protein [Porcipelethomonas sp.]